MKYFTPDLLARFGSMDDAVADAAHQEWEEVNAKYLEHLREIRPKLPRAAKSLLRHHCLHDAKLLALGIRRDGLAISMFLELDAPHDRAISLSYDLTKRAELLKHPALSEPGTPLEWLYDEFNIVTKRRGRPLFTHSILFTGGRELRLTFRSLRLTAFEKVVMPTTAGDETDLDALLVG